MKHLFIINPAASRVRGRVSELSKEIESFFSGYGGIEYDIHVTRWSRDASGFTRRYVTDSVEMVRIHVFGGSGTLFEVVNGTAGLPNVQIAAYPFGAANGFLYYFGEDRLHLFRSIRNQVFSGVMPVDAICCGNYHGISHCLIGQEAQSNKAGSELHERTRLPARFCFVLQRILSIIREKRGANSFVVELDGESIGDGYTPALIANAPCYGRNMRPATDAHPNDGALDIYMLRDMPRHRQIAMISPYVSGHHGGMRDSVLHRRGKSVSISSDGVMCVGIDGETFYDISVELRVIPYAVDFVCPHGVGAARGGTGK